MNSEPPINLEQAAEANAKVRRIGMELRRLYDTIASEPTPEDFLERLRQFDQRQGLSDDATH